MSDPDSVVSLLHTARGNRPSGFSQPCIKLVIASSFITDGGGQMEKIDWADGPFCCWVDGPKEREKGSKIDSVSSSLHVTKWDFPYAKHRVNTNHGR